jgi:hypothetical protein
LLQNDEKIADLEKELEAVKKEIKKSEKVIKRVIFIPI